MSDDPTGSEAPESAKWEGEEAVDERSTPQKNFVSSIVLAALGVFAMILSYQMPNPGSLYTHPGLLPFLVGLTLALMAVSLGVKAYREGGSQNMFAGGDIETMSEEDAEYSESGQLRRTLFLMGVILAYIVLVDVVELDFRFPTPFFVFRFSGFELASIPALAIILKLFWKARWHYCGLVSLVMIVSLASIFRQGFKILLPS